jgi:hypothetical protein
MNSHDHDSALRAFSLKETIQLENHMIPEDRFTAGKPEI